MKELQAFISMIRPDGSKFAPNRFNGGVEQLAKRNTGLLAPFTTTLIENRPTPIFCFESFP